MKLKNIALYITCASIGFASCNNGTSTKVSLDDDFQKTSYAFGYKSGESIAMNIGMTGRQLKALDTAIIMAGVIDYLNKSNPQIDTATISNLINEFQKNPTKFSSKTYDEDLKKVVEDSKKFLEQKAADSKVTKTESGLLYEVIKEGNGPKPKATDMVTVNYIGKLPDGTIFDQSPEGNPITFPLNGVIKGWTEGLQLMSVGSKYKFYIPSELAYGNSAQGEHIKPGHALEFEVELIKIGN